MIVVEAVDGVLCVSIDVQNLANAAKFHPAFYDVSDECRVVVVTDPEVFAHQVVKAIQAEDHDGSTLFHDFLDKAMEKAIEDGCLGVDHESSSRVRLGPRSPTTCR